MRAEREGTRSPRWKAWCASGVLLASLFLFTSVSSGQERRAVKAMWGPATRNGVSLFPTYRELGVKIYEDSLPWYSIAPRRPKHPRSPSDPAYVWPDEVTRAVREAGQYGTQVALQIKGSPRWANGNKPP